MSDISLSDHEQIIKIYRSRIIRRLGCTQYARSKIVAEECYERLNKSMQRHRKFRIRKKDILSRARRNEFYYMNPHSNIPFVESLLRTIEAYGIPKKHMRMITVIERKWEIDDTDEISGKFIKKIGKTLRRGMSGLDFIGVIEFAYFPKVKDKKWKGEKNIIAAHFHGITWSKITKDKDEELNDFFSGGIKGADGFMDKKVYDLVGAIAYCVKPLSHGYKMPGDSDDDGDEKFKRKTKPLKIDDSYRMYRKLKQFQYKHMLVSGGEEGSQLRTTLEKHLRRLNPNFGKRV